MNSDPNTPSRIANALFLLFLIVLGIVSSFVTPDWSAIETLVFLVAIALVTSGLSWWIGVYTNLGGQLFVVCLALAIFLVVEVQGMTNVLPPVLDPFLGIFVLGMAAAGAYAWLIRRSFP